MRRLAIIVSIVVSAVAAGQSIPCAVKNGYIPFNAPAHPDFTLWASFGVDQVPMQIDTGSTGIVVGRPHIPKDAPPVNDPNLLPYMIYSSSNRVERGQWVYVDVQLSDAKGSAAKATISRFPVLAVDKICTTTNGQLRPPFDCTKPTSPEQLKAIGMMGVGFDRGATMGPPTTNVFLNLPQMAPGGNMQHGYMISATGGITLGINADDLAGFQFVPLDPAGPAGSLEWYQALGCVSITGAGATNPGVPVCGSVLMDTGVDTMYITYAAASMPAFKPPLPRNASQLPEGDLWRCCTSMLVQEGLPSCSIAGGAPTATVTVTWPAGPNLTPAPNPVLTYIANAPADFAPTQKNPAGAHVRGVSTLSGNVRGNVFVNTSRQLLHVADYLYDADCGRIGFRKVQSAPR